MRLGRALLAAGLVLVGGWAFAAVAAETLTHGTTPRGDGSDPALGGYRQQARQRNVECLNQAIERAGEQNRRDLWTIAQFCSYSVVSRAGL